MDDSEVTVSQLSITPVENKRAGNGMRLKPYWFKPGQSGNPKGRPHRAFSESLSNIMREKIPISKANPDELRKWMGSLLVRLIKKGATVGDVLAMAILREAMKGNIQALREIADRTEGKPNQRIEIAKSSEHEDIDLSTLSDAEIKTLNNILEKANKTIAQENENEG